MSAFRRSRSFVSMVLVLGSIAAAKAEPYLAVREGLKCSACHVNRTGQGKRTGFGVGYSQTKLPAIVLTSSQRGDVLNRNVSDFFSVGADFRLTNSSTIRVKAATPPTKTDNTFLLVEGNIYGELTLVKDHLTFYVDEQVTPTSASREIIGIIRGLPNKTYVKVGRIFLPYGLRLWDFDAFIRSKTGLPGFAPAPGLLEPDFGVEVGTEPGPLSLSVSVSNGEPSSNAIDTNRGKEFSLIIAGVFPHARIGGSFSVNTTDPVFFATRKARVMGGPFIGLSNGPITVLGEVDAIHTTLSPDKDVTQVIAYGELDVLFARGLNAKVAFDYLDPKGGGAKLKRFRIGFEPFITQFLQPRVFYAVNRPHVIPFSPYSPFPAGASNGDQLTFELHVLF